jgi:tetratricopeptide (TPR) repeat protein
LSDKRGFIVEIEGFDEMMNEIRRIVEFDVPKMVGSIRERQDQMIEQFKKFEPQYSADILGEIAGALKEPAVMEDENKKIQALDFFSQAYKAQIAGDLSKAENLYCKVIELNPNDTAAYGNLGNLLRNTGRDDEAETAYRKAIELNPNNVFSYSNLGYLLRLQNREQEAMSLAEHALQFDSKSITLFLNLMALYKKLGRNEESKQYAAKAREVIKSDDWYNLACLESICGNTDAAIENLQRAAQQDSFSPKWARRDPDFEWIRDDPRFKEIVGQEDA